MKKELLNILNKYLQIYPDEHDRQLKFIEYLNHHDDKELIDWNNFAGHVVASGFIYSKEERKFLVLYHKDLKMYLYPGGHVNLEDKNILEAAKREVLEETGLKHVELLKIDNYELVPIDIDTHVIGFNKRLNLPEHFHFDFRYLFTINNMENINLDTEELKDYKWIDIDDLKKDINYGKISSKLENIFRKDNL